MKILGHVLFLVVYRSFPTSNHNKIYCSYQCFRVVYRSFPTSNHNRVRQTNSPPAVVYRSFPTSNHNCGDIAPWYDKLYIVRFLHQTTTSYCTLPTDFLLYIVRFLHQTTTMNKLHLIYLSCISFVSYIKPQQFFQASLLDSVVYRSFPTSNHNL